MAASAYYDTVQQLYIAYYGRPADPTGLAAWAEVLSAANGDTSKIINDFANSPESKALYSGADTVTFVNQIYNNVLGRDADVVGLLGYAKLIDTGVLTKAELALVILQNVSGTDVELAANKLAAAKAFTAAIDTTAEVLNYTGDTAAQQGRDFLNTVTNDVATIPDAAEVQAAVDALIGVEQNPGQTFTLTKSIDTVAGTTGNDTINAVIDATVGAVETTFTALDSIDGAAGTDTLNINALTAVAALPNVTISNVETINVRAAAAVGTVGVNDLVNDATDDADATPSAAVDFSSISGLNTLNITQGTQAAVKAAATTDVAVSGVTGGIEVNGGKTVTVTDAADGNNITVGSIVAAAADNANSAGTAAAGAITVTDTKQGAGVIQVDGGTTVTVTTTSTTDSGAIAVGATKAASGAVAVTSNLNGDGTAALDQGDITVTGGSTVTVNSNLTITAKDQDADAAHNFGDVRVNSDGKTTSVTVNQTYAETEFTKAAVAVVKETSVVTFSAMTSGQTLTFNGLTFTASKALTAAEVAAAFSNLTAADTQSAQGPVANGVFTGAFNTAVWTSGAANGAVVTFTAQDHDETDLSFTGTATAPTQVKAAGTAEVAKDTSVNTVAYGAVRVDGAATDSITTLIVNGYSSADLGNTSANDLNALTTLSLANSGGSATVDTSAATLGLTVNKVDHAVDLSGAASLKTLNVTATGANSTFGLNAATVETLTVAGDKVLDIDTGSTLTNLKTVTVSGSAGLSIVASGANVTSVNTSATTGAVTAEIDGSKATYTGGAGVDTVTIKAGVTALTKAISLGAGNDTLNLANASGTTTVPTAALSGGDGTDTLGLSAADAASFSSAVTFETMIDGFEKLSLGVVAAAASNSVDLSNMDDISYVISAGTTDTAETKTLTLTVGTAIAANDTVSVTINGTTYTTAALAAAATATDIAAAIDTAVGAAYSVTAAAGVLTFTSATGGTTTLSGLTVTGAGTVTGVEAETSSQLTLTKMANGGTLELTGAGVGATVTMTDATGSADSFNIVAKVDAANLNFGIVSVAGVETINLTATDTTPVDVNGVATISKATLALSDSAAKTVNVSGESDLSLDLSAALAVTKVDAASFTGKLTLTATGSAALTVVGGSAADTLTASGSGDVLQGGAGADTLTGANLTTLTGGAGNDIFKFAVPTNVNSYSSITDLTAGDVIDLDAGNAGTVVFTKSAVVLAGTAVFQDYANAAVNALGTDDNDAAWFQFGGNTYIVQSGNTTAGNDFVNGVDSIIQIVGAVDLSTASYNQSIGSLEIA